jgi:hypothetical protein
MISSKKRETPLSMRVSSTCGELRVDGEGNKETLTTLRTFFGSRRPGSVFRRDSNGTGNRGRRYSTHREGLLAFGPL